MAEGVDTPSHIPDLHVGPTGWMSELGTLLEELEQVSGVPGKIGRASCRERV